jgi:predicted Zn-dependent peptidase
MEKEKDIIIDEIHSYRDTPAEQIYDDFEMHLFKQHPLGNNILGTVESVKSFKQKHITDFIKRNYLISNMVFGVAGNYSKEQVIKLIEKHFGHYTTKGQIPARKAPAKQKAFHIVNKINTNQSHCIIGSLAPSASSKKRTGMVLLNNLLGGPGMNSRLNLNIREKYGFAYNLDSNYVAYSDTGLFAVYLGTDKKYLQKTTELVYKELKKLREAPIGALQLHKAKQQLCGNIALAQENNSNVMLALSKSMLMFNKIDSLHAIYNEIERISAQQLFNLANEVFEEKKLSTLTFE